MLRRILGAFCILMLILTFAGCSSSNASNLDFESGIYYYKAWKEPVGSYDGAIVADQETALIIARAILSSTIKANNYSAHKIFFDEQDEVWIITFSPFTSQNADGTITTGGGCSIAIQKSDGKVLGIWGEE